MYFHLNNSINHFLTQRKETLTLLPSCNQILDDQKGAETSQHHTLETVFGKLITAWETCCGHLGKYCIDKAVQE